MCGIFGVFNKTFTEEISAKKVKESALLMKHRGPDAYGQWGIAGKIELAHLRLSIIDLNRESNQPFFSSCGNFVIVFNGEIYNYIEIKKELIEIGYLFKTSSDTEVLLHSYIEWGENCVNKFNGDWAFCIYNIKKNVLFCSRDRFGVKPFNYAIVNDSFVFSSEIKSIINYFPTLKEPNYNVISNFCRNSLGAQIEETWFKGIKRLMPAHNIIIENGKVEIVRYWDYPKEIDNSLSFDEATEQYQKLFTNAVRLRMRSDVPVGTTLSSGIDSGSIVSVLRRFYQQEHNTFTASYDSNEYEALEKSIYSKNITIDEKVLVKRLANDFNLRAHFINAEKSNFCTDLSKAIFYLDSGHSAPAIIPLSKIMNKAKRHVTVVMEGQGADELLSGYTSSNFHSLVWELLKRGKLYQLKNEIKEFKKSYSLGFAIKKYIRSLNSDRIERFYQRNNSIDLVFGHKLKTYKRIKDYPFDPKGFDEHFNAELFKAHTATLVNLLHYGDAISMSESIESRLPFMDVNLVEFSFKLPYNFKMKDGLGKYIHRVAMKGVLPDYILENPYKFGFNTPLSQHFSKFDSEANRILLSDRCLKRGLFDRNGLINIIQVHVSKKRNHSSLLFRLLTVELWFRIFFDKK